MFKVCVSHDGCTNWEITLPEARGDHAQCIAFIASHTPPKQCEFDLIDCETGRCVSYAFTPSRRRSRLSWTHTRQRT